MEQTERKIHAGLNLQDVDQLNENIDFVREVLRLVLVVDDSNYVGGRPSVGCIVAEAMDRMKRIDETINPKPKGAEG